MQNKGIDEDDPTRGITGLVANALCAKYRKPTLVLNEIIDSETGEITWSGSGRGFAVAGIHNWRDYIANCGNAIFAQGHPFAFGVAFTPHGLARFKERVRDQFGTAKFEMSYDVDFIWTMNDEFDNIIMEIGEYSNIWGQGVPEPLVVIEHVKIGKDVTLNIPKEDDPDQHETVSGIVTEASFEDGTGKIKVGDKYYSIAYIVNVKDNSVDSTAIISNGESSDTASDGDT